MAIKPVRGRIESQELNDNFSYLESQKIGKTDEIGMSNLDQEVREAFTGGAVPVVGTNSVRRINIKDKEVTNDKLEVARRGINLFDKSKVLENKLLRMTDGVETDNPIYYTSDYIPIRGNAVYSRRYQCRVIFYDINKDFISSAGEDAPSGQTGAFGTPITSPSNAHYMRVSFRNANPNMLKWFRINEGDEIFDFAPYHHQLEKTYATEKSRLIASNTSFNYDEEGNLTQVIEDGIVTQFFYTADGDIEYIDSIDSELGNTKRTEFTFDNEGNITAVNERWV